jgi:ornithine carbamoyltransferase
MLQKPIRHFIDLNQINKGDLRKILSLAKKLKLEKTSITKLEKQKKLLSQKNLAMIFEKNSTRTRVSFEVAINQLGGSAIVMNKDDMQLGKGETVADTAKVLSRYVDFIMIRANSHQTILEFAKNSSVPVINALSDFSHPCQILASIMAIEERIGGVEGKILSWFGDANNVLRSYIHGASELGYEIRISSPKSIFNEFKEKPTKLVRYFDSPKDCAKLADVLITDTWFSMGDESEKNQKLKEKKIKLLSPYQVNQGLISVAKKSAIFTHCLPAYREYEVSSEIIDSKKSIVFDEAENRLHVQKAILLYVSGLMK